MSALKAVAVVALWQTGKFDTLDIAHALGVTEAEVVSVLDVWREANRRAV